ncbi:SMI1/KNR4 family protein [Acinetobacter gerneri]|jgi:hypothetical protein|uniref:SMI1/KNR4 family protein n=1 Tax=Acinetobacter gerneri TaxID=202952 RepID=UPI0023F1C9EC|nr:SMI1/KNR4 family protein [Acinetobacter gerneri]MCH4243499.1 SMI1/KNR4 family protein [Acinetobacter gerneri]
MNLEHSIQKLNQIFAVHELKAFQQPLATPEEIAELEHLSNRPFHQEFKRFYLEYGGVGYLDEGVRDTGMTIRLLPARLLILALQDSRKYLRLNSLGIIDWLRYQYDNDLSKLNEKSLAFNQLNQKYIGLGLRQYDHESARHLYIDEQGKFGIINFHQDAYNTLWEDYLTPMLSQSPANMSLEEALIELLENSEAPTAL